MGRWGITPSLPTLLFAPSTCAFILSTMSRPNFFNSKVTYYDNSKEYNINAQGSDVAEIMRQLEANDELSQPDRYETAEDIEAEAILPIPQKNKYTQVRQYIHERCRFDEEFKDFVDNHSRVDLCKRLSNEFGWDVDEHHLGVNMNRHR